MQIYLQMHWSGPRILLKTFRTAKPRQVVRDLVVSGAACIASLGTAYLNINGDFTFTYLAGSVYAAVSVYWLITQLYSLALPGTLAGGGITWLKCVQAGASKDAAAATVVFNRAVGLTFMMIVGTAAWIFDRAPEVPWLLAGVAAGTPLMIFLGTRPRDTPTLTSVNNGGWSWTTAMAHIRERFWMFRSLPAPAKLLLVSSSLAHEFLGGAVLLGFALALGLEVGLAQVLWIRAGLMLLLMMPMSVAGLGIREASLVGLGSLIGIDPASAVAWSLVTFAGVLIVAGVGGLMELQRSSGRLQPEQPENRT